MIFDLHSHTTMSDGSLTPSELVSLAVQKCVDVLAITDHDTVDAFMTPADINEQLAVVAGIELSTQWEKTGVHVVGLNINPNSDAMNAAVAYQSNARLQRAVLIGEKLREKGIHDAFEGARALSEGNYVGRPHFARYIVDTGRAKSMQAAFKKYMGDGKVGDVRQHWAELPQVIDWIRGAGGIPVLAHPLKYKLTRTRLARLVGDFMQAGGQGIEVVSGQQHTRHTNALARLCEDNNLLASCGSDFHAPGRPWAELGAFSAMPGHLTPVWERF